MKARPLVIPLAFGVPKIAIAVNAPSRANVGDTQLETGLRHVYFIQCSYVRIVGQVTKERLDKL